MTTKVLGKNISYSSPRGLKILDKIERNQSGVKYGVDIWNIYDFLFRDKNNLPIIFYANNKSFETFW